MKDIVLETSTLSKVDFIFFKFLKTKLSGPHRDAVATRIGSMITDSTPHASGGMPQPPMAHISASTTANQRRCPRHQGG